MSLEQLRADLDARGLTPEFLALSADEVHEQHIEGALRVVPDDRGVDFVCVDYGSPRVIASAPDMTTIEPQIRAYLDRPLPPVLAISDEERDAITTRLAPSFVELRTRLSRPESPVSLIQLPPGILLDRIGAVDGWMLNELNTSFESRSLPPTALREPSSVHQFVTEATVLVQASLVPAWFGQPGGALRFTIAEPTSTIRDLLVDGSLRRITTTVGAGRG